MRHDLFPVVSSDTEADGIVDGLQSNAVDTTCTPTIRYEHFAKVSLGVKHSGVEKKGLTPAFDLKKETYWVQVDIGYNGMFPWSRSKLSIFIKHKSTNYFNILMNFSIFELILNHI